MKYNFDHIINRLITTSASIKPSESPHPFLKVIQLSVPIFLMQLKSFAFHKKESAYHFIYFNNLLRRTWRTVWDFTQRACPPLSHPPLYTVLVK